METLTAQTNVGAIAAALPSAIRVFERHRIDYCCGGSVPLEQACREQGVAVESVMAETGHVRLPSDRDWSSAPLGELIDHIVGVHHAYLKIELPLLQAALDKVLYRHGPAHPEIAVLARTFGAMRLELENHLMKEEMVLFPLMRTLESGGDAPSHCGSVRNPIRVMTMEHDSAGEALAHMRDVTGGYALPEGACNTYIGLYYGLSELEKDLHLHIHLENNILFPRAVEMEAALAGR